MKKNIYNSEEEFLKAYNPNDYDRLSVTSDILIFSVSDSASQNYRKLNKKHFSVLMVKRNDYPFKGKWCLPGGFVGVKETIDEAALRILGTETNLHDIYIEQLYTFSDVNRDPRMRIISTSYMALIDKNRLKEEVSKNTSWFNITLNETSDKIEVYLDNGEEKLNFVVKKTLRERTTDRYEYTILENNYLAFDHPLIIVSGISRLKNKAWYTDVIFNMMPEYFTLGELQQVYEVILGKELLDPAFRRIIANKVEKTDKVKKGEGHRPSVLFKYKEKE